MNIFYVFFSGLLLGVEVMAQVAPAASPAAPAPVGVFSWLVANWMQVVVAVLAIDAALLPLFPDSGLLKKIQSLLGALVNKPQA